MLRYKLRTLLILLAVLPPLITVGWREYDRLAKARMHERQVRAIQLSRGGVRTVRWKNAYHVSQSVRIAASAKSDE